MDIIIRNYSQQLVIVVEYVLCVQYVNKDDKNRSAVQTFLQNENED